MEYNQTYLKHEEKLLVSIVIPVYNTEKYLPELWESIIKQKYKNIEIVFVDDGSCDGSYQLLQTYASMDKRVKLIHKLNEGRNSARQEGVRQASGNYVSFVDSDDVLDELYIYNLVMPLIVYEEKYDIIVGGTKIYGTDRCVKHLQEGEISFKTFWENSLSLDGIGWTLWGKIYRKSCIVGLDDKYVNSEDLYSNWIICNDKLRYYYVPKDGYIYRMPNRNKYVTDFGAIDILIQIGDDLPEELQSDKLFMKKYCIRTFYEIMSYVRGLFLYSVEGYENIINNNYKKWSEWVNDFLVDKYDCLKPFYALYLRTSSYLVGEYLNIKKRLISENSHNIYIFGAGIMARRTAEWMDFFKIRFDGFVVSRNAEKQENIDDIHTIKNIDDIPCGVIIWGMKLTNIIDVLENVNLDKFDVVYL